MCTMVIYLAVGVTPSFAMDMFECISGFIESCIQLNNSTIPSDPLFLPKVHEFLWV